MHRLDKDTTGLMVVAKNDSAHKGLAKQFASHGRDDGPFERGYLAFVWGAPDRPHGTVDRPIDRHRTARDRMAIREGGREAVTHWQVAERYGGQKGEGRRSEGARPGVPIASLLACRLETGRTHQIRVHLASIGHPLMGDDVYGPGFRTKSALLPQEAQAALGTLADRPCMPICCRSNTLFPAKSCGSARNCRPSLPVCMLGWQLFGLILAISRALA